LITAVGPESTVMNFVLRALHSRINLEFISNIENGLESKNRTRMLSCEHVDGGRLHPTIARAHDPGDLDIERQTIESVFPPTTNTRGQCDCITA